MQKKAGPEATALSAELSFVVVEVSALGPPGYPWPRVCTADGIDARTTGASFENMDTGRRSMAHVLLV